MTGGAGLGRPTRPRSGPRVALESRGTHNEERLRHRGGTRRAAVVTDQSTYRARFCRVVADLLSSRPARRVTHENKGLGRHRTSCRMVVRRSAAPQMRGTASTSTRNRGISQVPADPAPAAGGPDRLTRNRVPCDTLPRPRRRRCCRVAEVRRSRRTSAADEGTLCRSRLGSRRAGANPFGSHPETSMESGSIGRQAGNSTAPARSIARPTRPVKLGATGKPRCR